MAVFYLPLAGTAGPRTGQNTGKELVAAFPKHFPPIYAVTQNEVPSGFGVEFMELVAERAKLKIRYQGLQSWPATMQAMRDGKADLIPNLGIIPGRENLFEFSKPYDRISISIFVPKSFPSINSLNDLSGMHVGVVHTNYAIQILDRHHSIVQVPYPSLGDLVAGLMDGEVEAVVYPESVFYAFTTKLGIVDSIKRTGEPLATVERAIAVHKGNTRLIAVLNTAIDQVLGSPEYRAVYDRWHPKAPPFWNTQRVVLLVVALLFVIGLAWSIYRFRLVKGMNRELDRSATFATAILDATSDGIVTLDDEGVITSMNAYAESIFDRDAEELYGEPITRLISREDSRRVLKHIAAVKALSSDIDPKASRSIECVALRGGTESFPVRLGIAAMTRDGRYNFVCTFHDESRTQQAEQRVDQLVNYDPLTGMLNLHGALNRLKATIEQSKEGVHCLCLGLTHLTQINSVYGREVGDQVLVRTGVIMGQLGVREIEGFQYVARNSGNRVMMVVAGTKPDFEALAGRIRSVMDRVEIPDGDKVLHMDVDFVIGAASYPQHAGTAYELIEHAEIAYLNAKHNAGNTIAMFSVDSKLEQSESERSFQRIKSALNSDRLMLHFQPIQDLESGTITRYEALLRMVDENGELIMPADIIPIAERFHLITQIDYKVLHLVLQQLSRLQRRHSDIRISMNLSAVHLADSKLYDAIEQSVAVHGGNRENLIFEITETAALQNYTSAREFMNRLKGFGVRFALDDFGVGFTSFAQLRALPVDIVKIDGMFIRELDHDSEDQVLVRAISDVAHSLGKEVVAEFVENEAILQHLKEYGVDYAQGYYIGRPDPDLFVDSHNSATAASGS